MDQEVRSSDIFTVLANLMDSQSHGMLSSQNNNNNSNPTHSLRQNTIGTDTSLSNTQAQATTTKVMNARILNMTRQVSAAAIPGSNGSVSDAEIAEMERFSAFMNPNFTSGNSSVTNHNTHDPLYEAASQIGMQTEVGSMLDSRFPAYSSSGIDFTSSQNQALLEAFSTIDTSTVANLSCAQSYVSMLQHQPGELWSGQSSNSVNGNYAINSGNTRTTSNHTHENIVQPSSTLDKTSSLPSHNIHSSSSKSAMHMQHSSGIQTSNKDGRSSQQYHHNSSLTLQYRQNSKNINDLVISVNNDGLPLVDQNRNHGKEKKLTTTPIPSDADKSSCSSTSSGSISGPEQSPDHMPEQPSSNSGNGCRHNMDDNVLVGDNVPTRHSQKDHRNIRNIEGSKKYQCYGNMNLVNFGTINFTSVMDNSHNAMPTGDLTRNSQDGNLPVPTSDSVIQIDETVTSPIENIPLSPTTPLAMDQTGSMSQPFGNMQKMNMSGTGSFAQIQTVTTINQVRNADPNLHSASRKSRTVEPPNRPTSCYKGADSNGNNGKLLQDYDKNFASLSTVTQDKMQEKQKKSRCFKHKQGQQRLDDFHSNIVGNEVLQFDYLNANSATQASHLKPKVNADPTLRLELNNDTLVHPSLSQFNRQSLPQCSGAFTPGSHSKQLSSTPGNPSHPEPSLQNRTGAKTNYVTSGSVAPCPGRSRQWQTVTAVQGPKLPPLLSEQDRIPKRGRPSKKMMQQNLKVKKDNNAQSLQVASSHNVPPDQPSVSQPKVVQNVQPRLPSSNLVSTYTINDKGLMQEIAPKSKENRRSKERTQAFLNYLDEIKISSKQQSLASNTKPGEKDKNDAEKQRKRSRPRTKVFGKQVSQPLTESGITETMYTFSALAHQFKISSSIVERATENLLKSAAMKRNKEQQSIALVGQHQQRLTPDKNNNRKNQQPVTQFPTNKGVVSSHCEPNTTTSSKVPNVPTIKLPGSTTSKRMDNTPAILNSAHPGLQLMEKAVQIDHEPINAHTHNRVSSTIGPKLSANSIPVPPRVAQAENPCHEACSVPETNNNVVNAPTDASIESVSDSDRASFLKGKHKKKKHKKHKKHKYADSSCGKKKDKERKKKSKKKLKTKLTPSIIPSSSVSLVKPVTRAVLTSEKEKEESGSKKSTSETSTFTSDNKTDSFSSGFRQASNVDLDITCSWQQEDNTYDVEDSSSDEVSASPQSTTDTTLESTSSTPASSTSSIPLFAQYSNSRIGFGTFSMPAPKSASSDSKMQNAALTSVSAVISNCKDSKINSSFSSQNLARPDKKHSKHKKKKFFRKSKTCDPAFVAILDELLDGMKDLHLEFLGKQKQNSLSKSSSNIFFSTSTVDSTQSLLWRSPTTSSASYKTGSSAMKNATFPRDNQGRNFSENKMGNEKRGQLGLNKSKTSSQSNGREVSAESLSVFCRSPFFQQYGYISKSESALRAPFPKLTEAGKVSVPSNNSGKVPNKASKRDEKTTTARVASTSPKPLGPVMKTTDQVVASAGQCKEKEPVPASSQANRKRGWPRGRRRGPRAKKANVSRSPSTSKADKTLSPPPPNDINSRQTFTTNISEPKSDGNKKYSKNPAPVTTSIGSQGPVSSGPSISEAVPAGDVSKLVSGSLLQQIKQAIEANLPKHVNTDAITKSVDDAVQSYLQNMTKTSPQFSAIADEVPTKKKSGRRQSRISSSEGHEKVTGETSSKTNTEIHPKKLWACKHQDTESSLISKIADPFRPVPVLTKKRGPGRPRKNPLPDPLMSKKQSLAKQTSASRKQGKVPTASATAVPSKRRLLTVRLSGKPPVKPAVKRLIERAKNDIANRPPPNPMRQVGRFITKEEAFSCLSALCSVKAARVLAKTGSKDGDSEHCFYTGTQIETHILEAINTTVGIYHWDHYKQFVEACTRVEKEMGFLDEADFVLGEVRPKTPGLKKSIESVVEKLKNKQAKNMHSAATAFSEFQGTASSSEKDHMDDNDNVVIIDHKNVESNGKYRMPGRRQDIYEKVSSYKKDLIQSSKLHKVKYTQSINISIDGAPVKRPRGRPRKQVLLADAEPPSKKQKTNTFGKSQNNRESSPKALDTTGSRTTKLQNGVKEKSSTSDIMNPTLSPTKPYIAAGLYSSTFKKDPISTNRQLLGDVSSSSKAKLPAPFDAGLYLRSALKDFQLPYDIWWMYKHKKILPSQDPSTNYIEIAQNVYTSPRPTLNLSDHICTCNILEGENCGKGCLNRLMYIECQQSSCPCGQSCTNQVLQSGRWCDSLERFKTRDRGWGIRTSKAISEGAFILEYVGEVVNEAEFRMRTVELYHAYSNHYCVQLDASTVIDGYRMANEGRFVNHSCKPNCEMQKWCVNGEHRIGLFTLKQIQPNEELTYDYNFHAYNMNMQQECRCGSQKCRGFIGGRTQRSPSVDSDASSNAPSTSTTTTNMDGKQAKLKSFKSKGEQAMVKDFSILQMRPIPKKDKELIKSQQLFLLRNLAQVRRKEEEQRRKVQKKSGDSKESCKSVHKPTKPKKSRQNKVERKKLEAALTEMYTAIATCKDQNGVSVAIPFMNLPSKKKNPEYYKMISYPIDLSIIERNIVSNHYKDIETFNSDVQRVFKNAEKYHGRKSTLGKDVFRLRKAYANARGAAMLLMNGHKNKKPTKSSEVSDEDLDEADGNIHRKHEDHIRCICCIYKDEGLMVQCEKCYVWQHCDCMEAKPGNTDRYLCEECDPRPFSREVKVIPPPPNTPPGHTYYLTLFRDDLLVKQGDCAYLMRDHRLRRGNNTPSVRASHRNLSTIPPDKLDIFRVEQLWTDERGDKYAYGYHFLRPHETHHSPSRTFYHNELFASPFYEIIPLEAVVGLCCVMDLYTYSKGKPKEFKMCDICICDYRIDKAAGCFTRITKKRYPICTKSHVFDTYKHKIYPKKDFQPHHVPEQYKKSAGRPTSHNGTIDQDLPAFLSQDDEARRKKRSSEDSEEEESLSSISFFDRGDVGSSAWKKRQRLDGIAHKLLNKLPKQGE